MQVNVITKDAFSVLGIEGCGPIENAGEWIGPLWEKLIPNFSKIQSVVIGDGWGVMSDSKIPFGQWQTEGKYLAGFEVAPGTEAPEGWSRWDIPGATYAVVQCTMKTYCEALEYVQKTYVPENDYEQTGASHEHYLPEFRDINTDSFELYIPVRKK